MQNKTRGDTLGQHHKGAKHDDKRRVGTDTTVMEASWMIISVELRGTVRKDTGMEKLTVDLSENATILNLLDELQGRINWPFRDRFIDPKTGDLHRKVIVLVNRLPIRGKLQYIRLKNGDEVILFPHTVCG